MADFCLVSVCRVRYHRYRYRRGELGLVRRIHFENSNISQVIGSAIALNLLLHIPLVAGCAITLVDVLRLLLFYHPNGSMMHLRLFEYFVMSLVLGVMVCFCIQLSYIKDTSAGEVFKGYLPSSAIVDGNGI